MIKRIFAAIVLSVLLLTAPAVPVAKANGTSPQPGQGGGCIYFPATFTTPGFWYCWGGATPPTQ